jgi:3-methyladenine DNA glycosylase AlkD
LIRKELRQAARKEKATVLGRFFKTGKGEYAEGDRFLGVVVPDTRVVAKRHLGLSLVDTVELLHSPIHEERLCALLVMVAQYERGDVKMRKAIYRVYLANTRYINNWDLVDLSAPRIVGAHLAGRSKRTLHVLARSSSLWERRIAMIATFYDISHGDPEAALDIAERLVYDDHDLIHKAVGWMLREVGKRCSLDAERSFLDRYAATMPRTALRYAIERMSPAEKRHYITGIRPQSKPRARISHGKPREI